jgi:hypothetical protein
MSSSFTLFDVVRRPGDARCTAETEQPACQTSKREIGGIRASRATGRVSARNGRFTMERRGSVFRNETPF